MKKFSDNKNDVLRAAADNKVKNLNDKSLEGILKASQKDVGGQSKVDPAVEKKFSGLADKIIGRIKGVKKPDILLVLGILDGSRGLEVVPSKS